MNKHLVIGCWLLPSPSSYSSQHATESLSLVGTRGPNGGRENTKLKTDNQSNSNKLADLGAVESAKLTTALCVIYFFLKLIRAVGKFRNGEEGIIRRLKGGETRGNKLGT